jgi:hypothetical protein
MAQVFISYRRADTADMSRHIYNELVKHLDEKCVFRDVDTLLKGRDFRAGIERYIIDSDVMLVLIGDKWLNITDENTGKRRLDDPEDFVRIEADMGLRHVKTVIPVLVNGASMPSDQELPRKLASLAYQNALTVADTTFEKDFAELLDIVVSTPMQGSNATNITQQANAGSVTQIATASSVSIEEGHIQIAHADIVIDKPPRPQSEHREGNIEEFKKLYRRDFAGRQREIEQLDAWLGQSEKPIAVMIAPAGMGKSTLVVNWLKRVRETNRAKIVFHPISLRYNTHERKIVLKSLVRQLAEVYSKDDKPSTYDLQSDLLSLLNNPPDTLEQPLVVVIDGLDELDIAPELIRLPAQLANNIHLLVTIRQKNEDIKIDYDQLIRKYEWYNSKVERLSIQSLTEADLIDFISQNEVMTAPYTLNELAAKLYKLSDKGDPLIAQLYLRAIGSGDIAPQELEKHEPGLGNYIEESLRFLDDQKTGPPPIFSALAVAKGPLSLEDMEQISIHFEGNFVEFAKQSRGLIIVSRSEDHDTITFSHQRMGLAYLEKHSEIKQEWVSQFRKYGKSVLERLRSDKLAPENTPEYVRRYYVKHLLYDDPRQLEDTFALVSEIWMQAHYATTHSYENFLDDIALISDEAAKREHTPEILSIQVKIALAFSSVASLSSNLPPLLPALLVRDDIWDAVQARVYANRVPYPLQRARTRLHLLEIEEAKAALENKSLVEVIASDILYDLKMIQGKEDEETRGRLLLDLLPNLTLQRQFEEALELADGFHESVWRARLFGLLASRIPVERQVNVVAKVIRACARIDYGGTSDDFKSIPYIYEDIAQNLPMNALRPAWEYVQQNEELQEHKVNQFLEYLAWHIPAEKAGAFVELLYDHEPLPPVAQKITRFAYKLDGETALHIAVELKQRFDQATPDNRKALESIASGPWMQGVGLAFIALAYKKETQQEALLEVARGYLDERIDASLEDQPFSMRDAEERPISLDDLETLFHLVSGEFSDAKARQLVKEGAFLANFWGTGSILYDSSKSTSLNRNSLELTRYLGPEVILALYQRCTVSYPDLLPDDFSYMTTFESPYLLPNIAANLPEEKLQLIYDIGGYRNEYCSLGYIRAATQHFERMPLELKLDTLSWALSDIYIYEEASKELLTTILQNRDVVSSYSDEQNKEDFILLRNYSSLLPAMSVDIIRKILPTVRNSDKDHRILLIQYLPKDERKSLLKDVQKEVFGVSESDQQNVALTELTKQTCGCSWLKLNRLMWKLRNHRAAGLMLRDIQESGILALFSPTLLLVLSPILPWWNEGSGIHSIWLVPASVWEGLKIYFHSFWGLHLLLSPNYAKHASQKLQNHSEQVNQFLIENESYHFWESSVFQFAIKQYASATSLIASSQAIWYVTSLFSIFLLILAVPVAVIMLPIGIISLIPLGIIFILSLVIKLLKWRAERGNAHSQTAGLARQINQINHLDNVSERHKVFAGLIAKSEIGYYTPGNVKYLDYLEHAYEIWSALDHNLLSDAVDTINLYNQYDQDSANFRYVRFIIPPVALFRPDLLPRITEYFDDYGDEKAAHYIVLGRFLRGQKQLETLRKGVEEFKNSYEEDPNGFLNEMADFIQPEHIPQMLEWIELYSSISALAVLSTRIAASQNKAWIDQALEVAKGINESVEEFVEGVAPALDHERVSQFAIFVMEREENLRAGMYPQLLKRCLELPSDRAYIVWHDIVKEMQKYPRGRTLNQLSWLAPVIKYLGKDEAVVRVGESIMEVCDWWEVNWEPDSRTRIVSI